MGNIRLLPLLVLVSMLTFSVRMVDVFTGISDLSGSAQAAAKSAPPAAEEKKPALTIEDDVNVKAEEESPDTGAVSTAPVVKDETVEWRDPGDEDPSFQAVRREISEDLAGRRADLERREREMMTREALLKAGEQELDRKFQELSQLRAEIERLLKQQSDEENARIASLVKIYEGMKPKDAARIFDTLDLDILVNVMGRMSERKLSPILAEMNAERARTITIMLAEQKSLPEMPPAN